MSGSQIPHDAAYKSFFSDKDMVTSLFQDFVPEDFVRDIDFTTLELIPTNHVTKELRQRHDDIIWRVRWKDTYCYLYLLMEFQSTIDPFMAVRVLVYSGLLWEDLIATGVIKQGDKLPPIFPLVLYNGEQKWAAPQNVSELLTDIPSGLKIYQPSQKFFLIDQLSLSDNIVNAANGISANLIKIEREKDYRQLPRLIDMLDENLVKYPQPLRVKFENWLYEFLKHTKIFSKTPKFMNLIGAKTMLIERFQKWEAELVEKGVLEGMKKEREEGRVEGIRAMRETLTEFLQDRFNALPASMVNKISSINHSDDLKDLILSAYKVKDMAEFSALLDKKVKSNQNL